MDQLGQLYNTAVLGPIDPIDPIVYLSHSESFCIWVASSFFAQLGPAATGVSSAESPGVSPHAKGQAGSARSQALLNFEFYR